MINYLPFYYKQRFRLFVTTDRELVLDKPDEGGCAKCLPMTRSYECVTQINVVQAVGLERSNEDKGHTELSLVYGVLSPVSIQTQSLALRALRKRKPQETQAASHAMIGCLPTQALAFLSPLVFRTQGRLVLLLK